jgi:hypothetical protein
VVIPSVTESLKEGRLMSIIDIKEEDSILTVINHIITKKVEISADIQGSDKQFTTRLIKLKTDKGLNHLIIEKFYPEAGNSLIQSSPDVVFSAKVGKSKVFFNTKYLGINTQYPEFGLIVSFPSQIQIEEKRREGRIENGLTKILSVEFNLEGDNKLYQLKVVNLGSHGIGLVVDEENLDLLKKVNVRDKLKGLKFFLPAATLTIDCNIKHKTQVTHGKLKGSYVLGIKSDLIMNIKEVEDKMKKRA